MRLLHKKTYYIRVCKHLASFPGPLAQLPILLNCTASDGKLVEGLGMRPVNTPICRRVCKCVPSVHLARSRNVCASFSLLNYALFFNLSTLACTFTSQQTQAHKFYQIMSTYINRCHMHALVHAHTHAVAHITHPHMHSRTHPHTMLLFSFCHWGFHPMLITILYTGPLSTLAHP